METIKEMLDQMYEDKKAKMEHIDPSNALVEILTDRGVVTVDEINAKRQEIADHSNKMLREQLDEMAKDEDAIKRFELAKSLHDKLCSCQQEDEDAEVEATEV
jgi:hypothetical protein